MARITPIEIEIKKDDRIIAGVRELLQKSDLENAETLEDSPIMVLYFDPRKKAIVLTSDNESGGGDASNSSVNRKTVSLEISAEIIEDEEDGGRMPDRAAAIGGSRLINSWPW